MRACRSKADLESFLYTPLVAMVKQTLAPGEVLLQDSPTTTCAVLNQHLDGSLPDTTIPDTLLHPAKYCRSNIISSS